MGAYLSSAIPVDEPDKYILVPPIVAIDRNQRNRMCYSSYDWLFSKRELTHLMECFLTAGPSAVVHLSPPADQRFLISTNLVSPYSAHIKNKETLRRALKDCTGGLSVRFQGDVNNPLSFVELNVSQEEGSIPCVRSAYLHRETGLGFFTKAPLQGGSAEAATTGLRYSTPDFSAGAISYSGGQSLDKLWAVHRNGALTAGVQIEPRVSLADLQDRSALSSLDVVPSVCVQYRPQGQSPDSDFSATVEVEGGRTLRLAVYQHLALVRRVYNLFEDDDVVGISNYVDLGVVMTSPLARGLPAKDGAAPEAACLQATASWQANSNVVVKARAGTDVLALAVAVKSWWNPSFTLSLNAGWDCVTGCPRFGAGLLMDNDSELRYERGRQMTPTGSLVRQRHLATDDEVHLSEGFRPIVRTEGDASIPSVTLLPSKSPRPTVDLL